MKNANPEHGSVLFRSLVYAYPNFYTWQLNSRCWLTSVSVPVHVSFMCVRVNIYLITS